MSGDLVRLDRALSIAAQLVTRDGPKYLPVFFRLEREVEAVRGDADAIARAAAVARSYSA